MKSKTNQILSNKKKLSMFIFIGGKFIITNYIELPIFKNNPINSVNNNTDSFRQRQTRVKQDEY